MTKQMNGTYAHFENGVRMEFDELNVNMAGRVERNGGYCPCAVEKTEDTICPCKMFRESPVGEICLCGRFKRIK